MVEIVWKNHDEEKDMLSTKYNQEGGMKENMNQIYSLQGGCHQSYTITVQVGHVQLVKCS